MLTKKIYKLFSIIFVSVLSVSCCASADEIFFDEELVFLQKGTLSFKETNDTNLLKEMLKRSSVLLTEIELEGHCALYCAQKQISLTQWEWASAAFQKALTEFENDAQEVVQTVLPRYLSFLSTKEYQKSGNNSPRHIAGLMCSERDEGLFFARNEYVLSRFLSVCTRMYYDNARVMSGGGYAVDLMENLAKVSSILTCISHFFWTVEESRLKCRVKARKKGFFHPRPKDGKEVDSFWYDQKNARNLGAVTFDVLMKRIELFYFSYACLMKENKDDFFEQDIIKNKNISFSDLLEMYGITEH